MKTIAIYPGTFNKAHIGHANIAYKAQKIFGKNNVIIAMGINPDKINIERDVEAEAIDLSSRLGFKVITYSTFLHQLVESYESSGYNVVVIRGLRNGDDLDYEVNQMRFISDFKKDMNVIYLTCDVEFEHISSSAIRKIEQFGGHELVKKYLVK